MTPENDEAGILLREDRGAVSILKLNHPAKLNVLSNELLAALLQTLNDIELDPSVAGRGLDPVAGRFESFARELPRVQPAGDSLWVDAGLLCDLELGLTLTV